MNRPTAESLVDGLIVGARKCATSWLHRNFQEDVNFSTTVNTKETRYFTSHPTLTADAYKRSFQQTSENTFRIECDASICYDEESVEIINRYAPNARLALILRNPYEYLASRYIHSIRKGEVPPNISPHDFSEIEWVKHETNYNQILKPFKERFGSNFAIFKFEAIKDEDLFYKNISKFLTDGKYVPNIAPLKGRKVNTMRTSNFQLASSLLGTMSQFARSNGFHRTVNFVKRLGAHKLLENNKNDAFKKNLAMDFSKVRTSILSSSLEIWESL